MVADKQDKFLNVPTQGKVPHLRFPEFKNEWAALSMEDCLMRLENGANYDTNDVEGYPMSRIETISKSHIDYSKVGHSANLKNAEHYRMLYGDILFSHINSVRHIGKTAYYEAEKPLYHGMNLLLLRCKQEMDSKFIYYLLNNQQFLRKCQVLAKQAVNQASISTSDLRKIGLYVPQHDEQIRIAKFLSCIDERISTQIRIIEDLKSLSDVICERLYNPSEKESWQTYKYADLFSISNERNSKLQYTNVLSASQEYGMIERNELNIDIKFEASSIKNYKIVRPNQYVIHLRSFQGGFAYSDKTGVCSPAYTILVPNEMLSTAFLKYYFTSKKFINSLRIVTYGIRDGRSISVEEFLQLKVAIPNITRQQNIVRVMQLWEEKIRIEESYLTKLHQQKRHLLTTMFI